MGSVRMASPDELVLRSTAGRLVLVATVGASGMAMLDATVVNVALPHIGADFDADVTSLQWVLTGYLLALASCILVAGSLGDRYGRRRVFLTGTVWFAVASAACGAAPNVAALVAARVLQGVGAALLTPGSLAILQASFRREDRARAVGAWSGLSGVAGAIGPFAGGWLVDGPGWRWAFLVNLPISVLVVACSVGAVPESRDPDSSGTIDVPGALLGVVTLGAATWALTEAGPRGWTAPSILAAGAVALCAGAAFLVRMRRARSPLVPPVLFRSRAFTVTNLMTVLLYAAIGATFFLVAYQLQVAAGWSALGAGAALLPATVLMLVGSARSGALADRIGPRLQLTGGPLLAAVGLVLLSRIGTDATWWSDVLPGAAVFGLGLVVFVAPLTATVMASVGTEHVSVASGVNNAVARTATLASLSVLPVVSGLAAADGAVEITSSFRTALLIAAALTAAAAPVALLGFAPRQRAAARQSPRQTFCAVDGPPLEPDPGRCGLDAARPAGR